MRTVLASVLAFTFAVAACEGTTSLAPDSEGGTAAPNMTTVSGDVDGCKATGTGLTAVVVNEDVVNRKVVIDDCDVGAYFDEDGVVRNAEFEQPNADADPNEQSLVRVDGADVDVTGSTFHANEDYVHQILHIAYVGGATGKIADNTLTGFKRVGVLLDGENTSATVQGNEVVGVGAKSSGWAENGLQVSRGATGTLKDNDVRNHWWDENTFLSAGIIVFGSNGVTVQKNNFAGNDGNILIVGDDNNAIHNTVEATAPTGASDGIFHLGAFVSAGTNNGVRQNSFSTSSEANGGIFVGADAVNTKLIRNTFSGNFGEEIVDGGDDTKLPKPFDPEQ